MGMDYRYAGSASYPRFDKELCEVAAVFGGMLTEELKKKKEKTPEGSLGHWFGVISSELPETEKFVFPETTNVVLVKWFNNIYGTFTEKETKEIWELIYQHPEIQEISSQIWNELKSLTEEPCECWSLS